MASIFLQQNLLDSDPVLPSLAQSALLKGARTDAYDDAEGVAWVRYYGISNEALDSALGSPVNETLGLGDYLPIVSCTWQHDPFYEGYYLEVEDLSAPAYPLADDGEGNPVTWQNLADRPSVSPLIRDGRTFFPAGSALGTGSRLATQHFHEALNMWIAFTPQHELPPATPVAP